MSSPEQNYFSLFAMRYPVGSAQLNAPQYCIKTYRNKKLREIVFYNISQGCVTPLNRWSIPRLCSQLLSWTPIMLVFSYQIKKSGIFDQNTFVSSKLPITVCKKSEHPTQQLASQMESTLNNILNSLPIATFLEALPCL